MGLGSVMGPTSGPESLRGGPEMLLGQAGKMEWRLEAALGGNFGNAQAGICQQADPVRGTDFP